LKIFSVDYDYPDVSLLREAAGVLLRGGIIAIPTETVYGLAVAAEKADAVERLFELKGRPQNKPFTYLFGSLNDLFRFAGEGMPAKAKDLFSAFCPGPITIIYYDHARKTRIGARVPDHAVAQMFLSECRIPVFATSANPSSKKSAVDAEEIKEYFGDRIDALVDSGKSRLQLDSTVVELTQSGYNILRQGSVMEEEIARFFKAKN
jgi:L-threonylcarbamoyladenylate synthase